MQTIVISICSWLQWLHNAQKTAFHGIPAYFPSFIFFPPPLPWWSLSFGRGAIDVLLMAEHSPVTYFKHPEDLWISALTVIHCRNRHLWQSLSVMVVKSCKWKHLGGSLMTCPFSKTDAVNSLLLAYELTIQEPWTTSTVPSQRIFPCYLWVLCFKNLPS